MKLFKSKVAVGVMAVSMAATIGTAYAAVNPNAGAQLQQWYTSASNATKAIIAGDFAAVYAGKKEELENSVEGLKNGARVSIAATGRAEVARVNTSVNGQLATYSGQIDTANGTITSGIAAEYDQLVAATNATTNGQVNAIGTVSKAGIASAIRNHEGVYSGRLSDAAAATTTQAKSDLSAKIAATKAELNRLLALEKETATTEINSNLTTKIAELKAELVALTARLKKEAEDRILAQGAALEAAALNELATIVNDITKN
ncbi:hypothetical protein SY83_09690 [Paenibacillus swuensis]|uniref:Uncharacterized protein n=1 Tax=Paenibacillus swuensis TaxID=1178515 RepID=A0A172THH3_9BACL|nr:hypothetical protein [Paenibacillus swuensis]ANE46505.1 hypothetical protein SY83_09690 [Paenibacillus swuensis]